MPEPTPCPICGGSHPPDACPGVKKDETKSERILTPEQDRLQKGLQRRLFEGDISRAQDGISFAEQKGIVLDIASACQKVLGKELLGGTWLSNAKMISSFAEQKGIVLDFSKPEVAVACQKALEHDLAHALVHNAELYISFAEQKNISLDVTSACQNGLEAYTEQRSFSFVTPYAEKVISLAKQKDIVLDIATACQKGLEESLVKTGEADVAQLTAFAEDNGATLDVPSICQKALERCLFEGRYTSAHILVPFAKRNNIEFDVFSVGRKAVEELLLKNSLDLAMAITTFISGFSSEKVFDLYSHHLQKLFSVLEKKAPQLISQCKKSLELFFSLFAFRENPEALVATLEANPFLSQALEANPRFGPKLLLKYPEFDEVSRSKIQFLYEAKTKILAANPNIDPNSLEFRKLMQEKLRDFDRNKAILAAMKEKGIDTDAFLDYGETQYFTLKSSEETSSFADRLQAPISRLGETLDSYAHQVKNVLSAYREDLAKIQVLPKSAEELQKQIVDLEAKIGAEKTKSDTEKKEGKILGMERGLDGLRQKLAKSQTLSCWESITSEIERFRILKGGLLKSQQVLIEAETQYQATLSAKTPSGVEISKLKAKIGQAKEDFTKNLVILERRVGEFRDGLGQTISVLNSSAVPNRADAIVQEINERTAEQFSHFNSDRTTLASLFSEKTDKSREELENQPMSIFVFARNPDTDLYQGNYSPCCICIESEHMGAECTIADYNTDLGVQIINIWDETKNEPVTAAWCWVGIDEQGRTALVVDNIESNTRFSSTFPDKLSQELFAYLKQYAKAIGADRVVLGKANNDLPTASELAKLPEAKATYSKLGGENSRPDGYFLEAEDKSVKLLWEKGEGKKKIKEKKERKIIKLADVEASGLTKNDYAVILDLEEKIYEGASLVRGNTMIEDLEKGNGLNYSVILRGKRPEKTESEPLGYLVAYEDKTDDGDPCIYLDDIALAPDCQGQDLGWKLLESALLKMKERARQNNKPILFDMHLRPGSQRLFEKHQEDLKTMSITMAESALVPDYYDDGEDALYCVYEVKS